MSTVGISSNLSSIEAQFALVIQKFQANKQYQNPFDIITSFKSITALKAIEVGEVLADNEQNQELQEEFENWDLETKLWHLVEILYTFRASPKPPLLDEYPFSSILIKQENWLRNHPQIRELTLIISWLQGNTKSLDPAILEQEIHGKWSNTRLYIKNKNLNILAKSASPHDTEYVEYLDSDAPLRSNKKIHPDDESVDSNNFYVIYKLLLANKTEQAIEFANNSGNYTLGLILVGSTQDYYDPILDKSNTVLTGDDSFLEGSKASGLKHKLLWKQTVFKLSQRKSLTKYETLIYNFLSGGEISSNLIESRNNWEESLLLYLTQLYEYKIEEFFKNTLKEALPFSIQKPQVLSIDEILNVLLNADTEISKNSTHPLRIIQGGVMINKVLSLLQNIIRSLGQDNIIKPYLIRVVTHLSIFQLLIGSNDTNEDDSNGFKSSINSKDVTTIITLYISKLSDYRLTELIPIYLSIIPDEKDSRETYSLFLSSITDSKERQKQLEISKQLSNQLVIDDNDLIVVDDSQGTKMSNILRRTVERVMKKTEEYYKHQSNIVIHDDLENVDKVDLELYQSVEWFYDNEMYEDAISATLTIIRRFLLSGKLATLQKFAQVKNFKKLIGDYDLEIHTKSITIEGFSGLITDENKEELLEYEDLVYGLSLISDWKRLLHNQNLGVPLWESKEVEITIDKIIGTLNGLIFKWFQGLIRTSKNDQDKQIFKEFRTVYVPYLIIELLQIFEMARFKDWRLLKGAFKIINEIADEEQNDFLKCFIECGRLSEFLVVSGKIFVIASERGVNFS